MAKGKMKATTVIPSAIDETRLVILSYFFIKYKFFSILIDRTCYLLHLFHGILLFFTFSESRCENENLNVELHDTTPVYIDDYEGLFAHRAYVSFYHLCSVIFLYLQIGRASCRERVLAIV